MMYTSVLKDSTIFNRCFRTGRYCSCAFVTAYYIPNGEAYNRIGISASKKVGNAVERNRAKRIIRAACRLREKDFPIGFDIVFAVRNSIAGKKTQDIEDYISQKLLPHMKGSFDENGKFVRRPKRKSAPGKEKS